MAVSVSSAGPFYVGPATYAAQPGNNANAQTSGYLLQGWAALLTPQLPLGKVLTMIQTVLISSVTTVAYGMVAQLYYGPITSGVAAPAAQAAVPTNATAIGPAVTFETPTALGTAADLMAPVDMTALAIGLTPGQQYWFDLATKYVTGAGYLLTQNSIILMEVG